MGRDHRTGFGLKGGSLLAWRGSIPFLGYLGWGANIIMVSFLAGRCVHAVQAVDRLVTLHRMGGGQGKSS